MSKFFILIKKIFKNRLFLHIISLLFSLVFYFSFNTYMRSYFLEFEDIINSDSDLLYMFTFGFTFCLSFLWLIKSFFYFFDYLFEKLINKQKQKHIISEAD